MIAFKTRVTLPLAFAMSLLAATAAAGAAPEACQVLPADVWGGIMGYTVTATPGEMHCTYMGKSGGGQFRIMAVAASSAAAEAGAKGLNDMQPKDNPEAWRGGVYSSASVVFSIALFQRAATANTASQLEKLVAAAKQRLPK